jgi:hypothetical protein
MLILKTGSETWKNVNVAYFRTLSRHSSGGSHENAKSFINGYQSHGLNSKKEPQVLYHQLNVPGSVALQKYLTHYEFL